MCKIDGCDNPRVNGALMCAEHLGEKRRCSGRVTEVNPATGEVIAERQCKRSARPGNETCHSHGASSPAAKNSAIQARAMTAMERFVQPFQGDLDPISAFELEFRRTYGRILWLEEQIAALEDEALIWGKRKEEHIAAGEFPGTNTTYEAGIHQYEEMLRWERKHFLEMEKVYIKANLDERKLGVMRQYLEGTYAATVNLLKSLGHDTSDPEVRDKLRRMFEDAAAIGS